MLTKMLANPYIFISPVVECEIESLQSIYGYAAERSDYTYFT